MARRSSVEPDLNITIAGLLSDLALVQTSDQRKFGYRQAAQTIRSLDEPVDALRQPDGTLRRIPRIGPASTRVIMEVLETGSSATVDEAVSTSRKASDVAQRREWRAHFLSRAAVRRALADPTLNGPLPSDYHGDLQMHSTWSDGSQTLEEMVRIGLSRRYRFSAVTDHSAGLPIASGVTMERFADQHREIDRLNAKYAGEFTLLKGVEANIRADGEVDVALSDRRRFDIVVAAPHSSLRGPAAQTGRMLAVVSSPAVHILGHPRGRMFSSRPGVAADWGRVFAAAARTRVAIEIDGDPSRQDVDYVLARQAMAAGCLFALDSDAHGVGEWSYAETAMAHARLADIPPERIVNCWPLERLHEWATARSA